MASDASGGDYLSIFYRVLFADEANGGELYGKIRRHEKSGEEIKKDGCEIRFLISGIWWVARDSNPRLPPCKGDTLAS